MGNCCNRLHFCGILGMKSRIKVKTSITLPRDLIDSLDLLANGESSRSRLIEEAIRDMVTRKARELRDAEDLAIINRNADALNREAEDVLGYQVPI